MEKITDRILLVDSHHGRYIMQLFAQQLLDGEYLYKSSVNGNDRKELKKDLEYLADVKNMEDENYIDAEIDVEDDIIVIMNGQEFTLHRDDDLWAIPDGYEWPED